MLDRLNDTIVAVSSALGFGAVGIVRLSGPRAVLIADALFSAEIGKSMSELPGRTRVGGEVLMDEGERIPGFAYVFRTPRSYTRQDLVEVHTIGAPALLEHLCRRAVADGAVRALPGEFTARAFLNGGMELSAAEAVAEIIRAQSDTQLRAARRMMDGRLHRQISAVRDRLAEITALVEADIDFAEEPIEFISPRELERQTHGVATELRSLLAQSASLERAGVLPQILLLGPPNAGKSSLMNRLSGGMRSICSAVAGTTRDILSAPVRIGRTEAVLLDSAGIDRSDDEVMAAARRMALSTSQQVDLVCLVLDASSIDVDAVWDHLQTLDLPPIVIALNKSDLLSPDDAVRCAAAMHTRFACPAVAVSALTGANVEELRLAFANALTGQAVTTAAEAVWISQRQREAIEAAAEDLDRAADLNRSADETIDHADLTAFELREALDQLGAVTGQVTTEDLLGQVFSRFCIGK